MRQPFLLAAISAIGLLAAPARADTYGTYSGRGYNDAFLVMSLPSPPQTFGSIVGLSVSPAPVGTAANPVPVYRPAALYRLHRAGAPIYNAPPSSSDEFRLVPF